MIPQINMKIFDGAEKCMFLNQKKKKFFYKLVILKLLFYADFIVYRGLLPTHTDTNTHTHSLSRYTFPLIDDGDAAQIYI